MSNVPEKVFADGMGTNKVFVGATTPVKVVSTGGNMSALDETPSVGLPTTVNASGFISNFVPVIRACGNTPSGCKCSK